MSLKSPGLKPGAPKAWQACFCRLLCIWERKVAAVGSHTHTRSPLLRAYDVVGAPGFSPGVGGWPIQGHALVVACPLLEYVADAMSERTLID